MICLKAQIKGEPDVPPIIRVFEYANSSDEVIFYNSVEIIREKITKRLKINTNEALVVFCAYVVDQLRARKSVRYIRDNASKILSTQNVMIGVPETLRTIKFEAQVDKLPIKKIMFNEPIPITGSYILTEKSMQKSDKSK
jgi:urease gamma subunit